MTADSLDARWLRAALAEGEKGRPSPEPHVGVVVATGDTRWSARHRKQAGHDPWAQAIQEAVGAARGATLYCSLEPPIETVELLRSHGMRRVVYATSRSDTGEADSGLLAAGIETAKILPEEGDALIRDWRHVRETGTPFTTLKAAVTLDGRTATRTGDSKWITGDAARTEVHRMRANTDAILVGVGTVFADDPALTVRHVDGPNPIRVVLDTHLRTPPDCQLAKAGPPTWVVHGPTASEARRAALSRVELIEVPNADGHVDLEAALRELVRRDIVRLMVEGGATVHGAFLRRKLAQRAAVFVAPVILGDDRAHPLASVGPQPSMAAAFRLEAPHARTLGADVLVEGDLL